MARPNKAKQGKGTRKAVGRPSNYRAEYALQAEKLCRLGATDKELADFFEVDERTIDRWKKRHVEFCRSLKKGKGAADAEVADRLYQRALGYSHEDSRIMQHDGAPVIVPTVKHYPPDTLACIYWLKNRRPDLWRDKVALEHSGPDGGPIRSEAEFRPSAEDEEVIRRIADARKRIEAGNAEPEA